MKDVMIDLETFGNGNMSLIVQVGACYFDRHTGEIGDTFSLNVDADTGLRHGFQMDGSTIYWWLQQNPDAQKSVCAEPRYDIVVAMNMLNDFLKKASYVWSHATFDFVIVMNTLKRLNIKPSIHYRSARDIRTLVDLAGINHRNYQRVGVAHNGLDDCIYQVKYVVDCINAIQKS
jgi:hypothetical protein